MSVGDIDIYSCVTHKTLQLILLPTEACNFRCVYCYEEFKYNRMDPLVVQGIKNYIALRAPELDFLTLTWFGGEPLLARDIIQDILVHAHAQAALHPRMRVTSDITTNASLLSRSLFERLLALKVRQYQISFDGPRQWHDKMRVLANGKGTFDRVWANVTAMREVKGDFSVLVRLHINTENHAALPEFIEQFRKTFGDDKRFRLFLRPLSRLGGPNDHSLPVFGEKEGDEVVKALSRCAEEHRAEHVTTQHFTPICYAARGNSFVVRSNGRLNKCTVALEHPNNDIGRIRPNGRLELASEKIREWMRGLQSRDPGELECPMHGLADLIEKQANPRPAAVPAAAQANI